jgi:hypothetical protein
MEKNNRNNVKKIFIGNEADSYAADQIEATSVLHKIYDIDISKMSSMIIVPSNLDITYENIDFSQSLSVLGYPLNSISRTELKTSALYISVEYLSERGTLVFEEPVLDPISPALLNAPEPVWVKNIDGVAIYFCELSKQIETQNVVLGMNSYPSQVGFGWSVKIDEASLKYNTPPDLIWISAFDDESVILFIDPFKS